MKLLHTCRPHCILPILYFLVQNSYKYLSLLVHPDRAANDPEATEKFQVLGQVYAVLMCEQKRHIYAMEKSVLIVSDEEYAKCKMLYAGENSNISCTMHIAHVFGKVIYLY